MSLSPEPFSVKLHSHMLASAAEAQELHSKPGMYQLEP